MINTAMILAAGRGSRMRELTDHCPKPLIKAAGKSLIEYHLEALATAGIEHIVINTAYLGAQIPKALGNGERWQLSIEYSHEGDEGLETAGGIIHALPKLVSASQGKPFLVVNGDVFTEYPYQSLILSDVLCAFDNNHLAHLVLTHNPAHNPKGDFSIEHGKLSHGDLSDDSRYTFTGIGVYHPDFFAGYPEGKRPMRALFEQGIAQQCIGAEQFEGYWSDIGTPERLKELEQTLLAATQ